MQVRATLSSFGSTGGSSRCRYPLAFRMLRGEDRQIATSPLPRLGHSRLADGVVESVAIRKPDRKTAGRILPSSYYDTSRLSAQQRNRKSGVVRHKAYERRPGVGINAVAIVFIESCFKSHKPPIDFVQPSLLGQFRIDRSGSLTRTGIVLTKSVQRRRRAECSNPEPTGMTRSVIVHISTLADAPQRMHCRLCEIFKRLD